MSLQEDDMPKWPLSAVLAFFGLWLGAGWDLLSRVMDWPYGLAGAILSVVSGVACLGILAFHPQARARIRSIWSGRRDGS
jgi:hypothetical protein